MAEGILDFGNSAFNHLGCFASRKVHTYPARLWAAGSSQPPLYFSVLIYVRKALPCRLCLCNAPLTAISIRPTGEVIGASCMSPTQKRY